MSSSHERGRILTLRQERNTRLSWATARCDGRHPGRESAEKYGRRDGDRDELHGTAIVARTTHEQRDTSPSVERTFRAKPDRVVAAGERHRQTPGQRVGRPGTLGIHGKAQYSSRTRADPANTTPSPTSRRAWVSPTIRVDSWAVTTERRQTLVRSAVTSAARRRTFNARPELLHRLLPLLIILSSDHRRIDPLWRPSDANARRQLRLSL
jgi:hypothetical protein